MIYVFSRIFVTITDTLWLCWRPLWTPPQPLMHWSYWTVKARGAVLTLIWIEWLSWSILHGLLALRISSPKPFSHEEMRFFHLRICCCVRTGYTLLRSPMAWDQLRNTLCKYCHTRLTLHHNNCGGLHLRYSLAVPNSEPPLEVQI